MTASDDKPLNPKEEVALLREQLEALKDPVQTAAAGVAGVADKAASAVSEKGAEMADQATEYAKQAYAAINEQTEWIADRTRQSPAVVLVVACVVGYILGRIVR